MTIGIYKLVFNGTDRVYIGQSVRIEKRFQEHIFSLKNGTANTKLLEAYKIYGSPMLDIILECNITELNDNEDTAIDLFNSVDNGFNIYSYSNQAPTYIREFGQGNSKYSKQQILDSFHLLVNKPELSYNKIANITKVSVSSIENISSTISHNWLELEHPIEYSVLRSLIGKRDKLSAKARGIRYPFLLDPCGNTYKVENVTKFAIEHDLERSHLSAVLNGSRKSHKGWKVCQDA